MKNSSLKRLICSIIETKVVLGPGVSISKNVLQRIKTKKVGSFVANLVRETLTREYMATQSYRGQRKKKWQTKPKPDPHYAESLISKL